MSWWFLASGVLSLLMLWAVVGDHLPPSLSPLLLHVSILASSCLAIMGAAVQLCVRRWRRLYANLITIAIGAAALSFLTIIMHSISC